MNIFYFQNYFSEKSINSKNLLHPKKDLIFALNFGGSQGESSHAL